MDAERYLRELAERHLAVMHRSPQTMHSRFHQSISTRLHGALEVLVELGMIDSQRGSDLVREILSEPTNELLDRGDLTKVRAVMGAVQAGSDVHLTRRQQLQSALDVLNSEDILGDGEYRIMSARLDNLPDDAD